MTIQIDLTPDSLGVNPCYTSEQQRLNDYVAHIQATLPINFTTVIVSATAPGPDDRDKLWIQVDGNGRIVSVNTFSNGQWQTINPVAPYLIPGEFRQYDPSLYTPVAPWFACDGSVTGVPDLRGRFLVATGQRTTPPNQTFTLPDGTTVTRADTNTNFASGAQGGEELHILIPTEIPTHAHTPLTASNFEGQGSGGQENFGGSGGPTRFLDPTTGFFGGNYNGHNNLPPYYAVAMMQWRPDLT